MTPTRREVLSALTVSSAAILLPTTTHPMNATPRPEDSPRPQDNAQTGAAGLAPAYQGKHALVPLPFDPKTLKGISEKLIVSHHENNYGGALRNLNKVEVALAAISKDSPPFVVAGLKERELVFSNSVKLHELYFANLGGDGQAAGEVAKALGETYGTLGRWEEEFRATGGSLGGGSGWVILDFDLRARSLRTHWSGNHTQASACAVPLLVMDMYEHAYQMDYGAGAAKYIDAFFQNLRWEEVERRFARAMKAAQALQG
jgi:Fe-Mn family superoxide dismutase